MVKMEFVEQFGSRKVERCSVESKSAGRAARNMGMLSRCTLGMIPSRASGVRLANLRWGGSVAEAASQSKLNGVSLAKEEYSNAKDTAI